MYGSGYPHWSASTPADVTAGMNDGQAERVLCRNAAQL